MLIRPQTQIQSHFRSCGFTEQCIQWNRLFLSNSPELLYLAFIVKSKDNDWLEHKFYFTFYLKTLPQNTQCVWECRIQLFGQGLQRNWMESIVSKSLKEYVFHRHESRGKRLAGLKCRFKTSVAKTQYELKFRIYLSKL